MNLYTKWILIIINAIFALSEKTSNDFRLPKCVVPFHYKLKILTKLTDDFSYNGKVWIDVEAMSDVGKIVLNSKNLKIYENETTVEELSDEALKNIFLRNKKKNRKKSLETEYAKDSSENGKEEQRLQSDTTDDGMTDSVEDFTTETYFPKVTVVEATEGGSDDVKIVTEPESGKRQTMADVPNDLRTDEEIHNSESTVMTDVESSDTNNKIHVTHIENPQGTIQTKASPTTETHSVPNSDKLAEVVSTSPSDTVSSTPGNKFDLDMHSATEGLMSHSETAALTDSASTKLTTAISQAETSHSEASTERATATTYGSKPSSSTMSESKTTTYPTEESGAPTQDPNSNGAQVSQNLVGNVIKVQAHEYDFDNNFITINLSAPLRTGRKYRIQLRFRGVLSDSLTGFYRVSYRKKESRKATWLASTVFEPNEARSVFPCFDEPEFKATFDVSLAHDKKYTALSNMPVKSTAPVDGITDYRWTIFERSPKMSTYLVAFLISDLQYFAPKLKSKTGAMNTTYRFWGRQDVIRRAKYAAKIVPEMKNYMENLLGVPDVMPKYDFVALPTFISNALENWGLLSFAEKKILYTPGFSSVFSKLEITQILGHEVSHIWFGNLVTPKYWDQVWLSEGFSNFFEVIAADHVQPTWDVKTISLVVSYLTLFSIDAMHSSHPLVPRINNLNDVNEIFDSIRYQKGYFIVRMLNHTLGEETFMKSIRQYLSTHKFSNVDEGDLWDILTMQAHVDGTLPKDYHLRDIMKSWTRRAGYPVIDVLRDYENRTADVTQRRFLRPKFDLEFRKNLFQNDEPDDTKWWIPLTYTTERELNFADTKPRVWIKPTDEETILTDMPDENQFVLMNLEASGLYRVNYDEKNWELLIEYLLSENYSDISIINRVQIIDDLLDFARAGEISYVTAFEASNYLKREKNFLPWKAALSNFEYIGRMLRSTDSNKLFRKFLRNLTLKRFEELGMEPKKGETISDALNRKQITKWACQTGLRQCTRKSLALFKKWTSRKKPDENNPIPSNIRSVVYCSAISHGGPKDWQFLWQRYLNNIDVTDKIAIINGLGCSRNQRTLRKYLNWSLDETSGIRKQDSVTVFKSVARNDVGFNIAKDFLKSRMDDIKKYMGNNRFYVSQMIDSVASKMNRESHLGELEFIEEKHFSNLRSVPRSFKQAKEKVAFNIDWVEQNYKQITEWLQRQNF